MKVKSESEVARLCLTLSDPMDCSPPGSSIHRIFQARVLEWGATAVSRLGDSIFHLLASPDPVIIYNKYACIQFAERIAQMQKIHLVVEVHIPSKCEPMF